MDVFDSLIISLSLSLFGVNMQSTMQCMSFKPLFLGDHVHGLISSPSNGWLAKDVEHCQTYAKYRKFV